MSDIIQSAKKLFENRYHDEPWLALFDSSQERFWIETDNFAEVCGDFVSENDTRLAAAAPELAQALAEETYFYGVQVWMGGRWIMMLTRDHGTGLMHRGKWFERKDEAQACAAKWNHDTPTRIVRQRRSPVEVINE